MQVLYMGRAPRTKETLPDFLKWRRVTQPPLVFRGLTGSQRTPGFWGVTESFPILIRVFCYISMFIILFSNLFIFSSIFSNLFSVLFTIFNISSINISTFLDSMLFRFPNSFFHKFLPFFIQSVFFDFYFIFWI